MSLRKAILRLLIALVFTISLQPLQAGVLSWSPNPETDVAGYRIYYRTAFQKTPDVYDVGSNTKARIPNLLPETKYFVSLTAYNIHDLESAPSEEVAFFTPPKTPSIVFQRDSVTLKVEGETGGTLELFESDDLKKWNRVRTILNPTGTLDLRLERHSGARRKFYRLGWSGSTFPGWLAAQAPHGSQNLGADSATSFTAYASGSDLASPRSATPLHLGTIRLKSPSTGEWQTHRSLTVRLRESAKDVFARLETSTDMKKWIPAGPLIRQVKSELNGDGTRSLTFCENKSIQETRRGKRYFRVRYSQEPLSTEWTFDEWLAHHKLPKASSRFPGVPTNALYAYASGADLLDSPRQALPKVTTHRSFVEGRWESSETIEFRVREGLTGLEPELQISRNLRTWDPADTATFPLANRSNGDGTRTLVFQSIPNQGRTQRGYFRVVFRPTE